jgi:S1-C subfamily serine protease
VSKLGLVAILLWAALVPAASIVALVRLDERTREVAVQTEELHDEIQEGLQDLRQDLDATRASVAEITGQLPPDVPAIITDVRDSVVTIEVGRGLGSGFAIEADKIPLGYETAILTSAHVVRPSIRDPRVPILVTQGAQVMRARLGEADSANDLALLFVPRAVPVLTWATMTGNDALVGDLVVAVGSPFGLEGSTTVGVISEIYPRLIQTDAAINPGNSGGPLLDRYGEVLGVNTFGLRGAENLNFAFRIERACEQLLRC